MPEGIPEGELKIIASDALTARKEEEGRIPHRFQPRNLAQLIRLIEEQDRNNEVIIRFLLPQRGAVVSGKELPVLPESVLAVMRASPEAGWGKITEVTNLMERRLSTPWVISPARHSLPLRVKSENED